MGCGASAAKYSDKEPTLPAGKYVSSVDEGDSLLIQGNIISGSLKFEHSIGNVELVPVTGKLYYNDKDSDGNHLWRAEWDNKQLSIFRVEGEGEEIALHLPFKCYQYRGGESCVGDDQQNPDHQVIAIGKGTKAPATPAEPQSQIRVKRDGDDLPSMRPDATIRKEQQEQIASGVAERAGTSIKLDPGYAEVLRKKAQVRCDHVGGIQAMFDKFDLDRSKTIDVNEFIRLMMSLPREYREDSTEVICQPTQTHVEVHRKGFKEKALTEREATALFWHLDEDDSDFLEFDELTAWLLTGRRPDLRSWRRGGRR